MIKMQSGDREHQVTDQCNSNKRKTENSEAFISLSFSQKSFTSETLDQIYCANKSPERETLPHSHFCCLLLNLRVMQNKFTIFPEKSPGSKNFHIKYCLTYIYSLNICLPVQTVACSACSIYLDTLI